MSMTALRTLARSSKATVLVGALAILATAFFLGKISANDFLGTIKYLVPAWMVAHAGEKGATALAHGRSDEEE